MSTAPTPERRRVLAQKLGKSDAYLYQCLSGLRDMNPAEARRLEEESGGELTRRLLCQKRWHLIWPELADSEGAAKAVQP